MKKRHVNLPVIRFEIQDGIDNNSTWTKIDQAKDWITLQEGFRRISDIAESFNIKKNNDLIDVYARGIRKPERRKGNFRAENI